MIFCQKFSFEYFELVGDFKPSYLSLGHSLFEGDFKRGIKRMYIYFWVVFCNVSWGGLVHN